MLMCNINLQSHGWEVLLTGFVASAVLKGMAFINTERELDFRFAIIPITEVGKVIATGIPLIPEAVGLQ